MCEPDISIRLIWQYKDNYFFEPELDWDREEFQRRTYQRWAADEIAERIEYERSPDPIGVIEQFISLMRSCIDIASDKRHDFQFKTAAEAAEELGILFV